MTDMTTAMMVNDVIEETSTDIQFSAREAPWMKLGKITDGVKNASEAAKLGGLDFKIALTEAYYAYDDGMKVAPKRKAVIREDTGEFFDLVSDTYQPLQYREAFDFMDAVDSLYVAAGSLRGGRQGFVVVKAPFELTDLSKSDPHDLYAVLRTSHDRSRGIEVAVMPLRGRCMNQLTLASFTKDVPYRWSIKHSYKMHAKLAEAKDSLTKLANYAGRFEQLAQRLMEETVNEDRAHKVLTAVVPARAKQADVIEKIITLQTAEQVGFAGTGWGLVNAVSEYMDWQRSGGTAESRFLGALEGQTTKAINKTIVHLLRAS
jgi:phage/plasmid-like protein (TIGR03299 family)